MPTTTEQLEALFRDEDADEAEAYRFLAEHDAAEARGERRDDAPTLRLRRGRRFCQTQHS